MKVNKELDSTVRPQFNQAQNQERRELVKQDVHRQAFHLMAPVGWVNDPNGLCEFNGVNHIFYQYSPENPTGKSDRGWGHYTTHDWITYQEEDDPLVPETIADKKGSYSGSAFIKDGQIHFFYTGNNKLEGDYDYILKGRTHWTLHFSSPDGIHFSKRKVIMKNDDYPENLSCHVRDPKVIEDHGIYHMVLGARTKDHQGMVQVFESKNLLDWKPCSIIRPKSSFGYMWECPDIFDLDGQRILITCPQGIQDPTKTFENESTNVWIPVQTDLSKDQIVEEIHVLDHGHDFYAPQSFLDENNRRILIGWMGYPDPEYDNPTIEQGWQHCLTLPRELSFKNGKLIQKPLEEILKLRRDQEEFSLGKNQSLPIAWKAFDMKVQVEGAEWTLNLSKEVSLSYKDHILKLDLKEAGKGRTTRQVHISEVHSLEAFVDHSSLEIFVNGGEETFTTRVYDISAYVLSCDQPIQGTIWKMDSFTVIEKIHKNMDPSRMVGEIEE